MKKISLLTLLGLFLVNTSCKQSRDEKDIKKNINDQYTGILTEQDLAHSPDTKGWFDPIYKEYTPEKEALKTIEKYIDAFTIVIFMGTWCPDSHREIPKFYKILEEVGYNQDHLKVYALDDYKSSKAGYEDDYNFINVPSIIFYKNEKEVNRFVEMAQQSLAKDIAKIVSGQPYKNIYKQ